jgi:hypothetical protein
MASTSINTVPKEVLQSILARVRNSGSLADFVPCLRVCRMWNEDGGPLAWRVLVLDNKKMDNLVLSELKYGHPFHFVSSLTISVAAPYPQLCHCNCHHEDYLSGEGIDHYRRCCDGGSEVLEMEKVINRVLALMYRKMTNLNTFSIRIDIEPRDGEDPFCGCTDISLSNGFVSTIIKSLPKTCLNLELDIGGAHIGCCCSLLRESLRQLSHLRLRVETLCWRLLSDSEPSVEDGSKERRTETRLLSDTLRSMLVSSVLYPRSKATINHRRWLPRDMRKETSCQKVLVHDRKDPNPQLPSYFASLDFASTLPNIERLHLWTSTDREPDPTHASSCLRIQMEGFVRYDVLEDRSYLLPFTHLAEPQPWVYEHDCGPLRQFTWNMMRDENDEVLVGGVADMEAHFEDDWVTSIEGARFPGLIKTASEDSLDAGMVWEATRLQRQDEFEKTLTSGGGTIEHPQGLPDSESNYDVMAGYQTFPYAAELERHTFTTEGYATKKPWNAKQIHIYDKISPDRAG